MIESLEVFANMARGWNLSPEGTVRGSSTHALSSAMWVSADERTHEVTADPLEDRHVLAVIHEPLRAETFVDGAEVYGGTHLPGTLTFVRAGGKSYANLYGRFRIQHIYVPSALLRDVLASGGRSLDSVDIIEPQGVQDDTLLRVGRIMLAEMVEADPLTRLRIDGLGLDLAVHFLRQYSNYPICPPAVTGGLAGGRLRRVCERMADDPADEPSLAELAALVGLSAEHFCRAFRRSTGLPPHRWLAQRRLERARALLADRRLSLAEVSAQAGFSDPGYFSRLFRRATGVTPLAWRQARRS